jgi:hypothetical protein
MKDRSRRVIWWFLGFELVIGLGVWGWWSHYKLDDRLIYEEARFTDTKADILICQDAFFAQKGRYATTLSELILSPVERPISIRIEEVSLAGYTIRMRDGLLDRDVQIRRIHMDSTFIANARATAPAKLVAWADSVTESENMKRRAAMAAAVDSTGEKPSP